MKDHPDDDWKAKFLDALERTGVVRCAAKVAHVSKSGAYKARSTDPEFSAAWDDALQAYVDELIGEARKRALNGSDTLLMFLIKAARPEYRDSRSSPPKDEGEQTPRIIIAERAD